MNLLHIFELQIYEDIMEGKIYQTITCYKPRSLISFSIGKDTFVAFLEAEYTIKVKAYLLLDGIIGLTVALFYCSTDIRLRGNIRIQGIL